MSGPTHDAYGNPYIGGHFQDQFNILEDDFPYQGPSPSGNGADGRPLSEWGMLARGKTLGKRCVVVFNNPTIAPPGQTGTPANNSPVNMLEVKGDDEYAMPLTLTLTPPQFFPVGTTIPADPQNLSGSQTNIDELNNAVAASPDLANPIVIIQWGVGGVSHQAICDIFNGLCVNITASWVRVQGAVEARNGGQTNLAYQLGATLGPGQPKDKNAQRTFFVGSLGDGVESSVFPVPAFAKSVYITGGAMVAGTTIFLGSIRFFSNNLGAAGTAGIAQFSQSGFNQVPIPIPNGGYYFSVINQAGEAARLHAIFELGI